MAGLGATYVPGVAKVIAVHDRHLNVMCRTEGIFPAVITSGHFKSKLEGELEIQHLFTIGDILSIRATQEFRVNPKERIKSARRLTIQPWLPPSIGILKRATEEPHSYIQSTTYGGIGENVKVRFPDFLSKRDGQTGKTGAVVRFIPVLSPNSVLAVEVMEKEDYLPSLGLGKDENLKRMKEIWKNLEYVEQFQEEETRKDEIVKDIQLLWLNQATAQLVIPANTPFRISEGEMLHLVNQRSHMERNTVVIEVNTYKREIHIVLHFSPRDTNFLKYMRVLGCHDNNDLFTISVVIDRSLVKFKQHFLDNLPRLMGNQHGNFTRIMETLLHINYTAIPEGIDGEMETTGKSMSNRVNS